MSDESYHDGGIVIITRGEIETDDDAGWIGEWNEIIVDGDDEIHVHGVCGQVKGFQQDSSIQGVGKGVVEMQARAIDRVDGRRVLLVDDGTNVGKILPVWSRDPLVHLADGGDRFGFLEDDVEPRVLGNQAKRERGVLDENVG